jgi:hypothetical protein
VFHVPERARIVAGSPFATPPHCGNYGAFLLDSVAPGWRLFLICSEHGGWEHVSVHARRAGLDQPAAQQRTPTWAEMAHVKDLCWDPEDVVMQLHPRRSAYVNDHPHTLHLWRPVDAAIPEPPSWMVGPGLGTTREDD